jgi:hypothetical protein
MIQIPKIEDVTSEANAKKITAYRIAKDTRLLKKLELEIQVGKWRNHFRDGTKLAEFIEQTNGNDREKSRTKRFRAKVQQTI